MVAALAGIGALLALQVLAMMGEFAQWATAAKDKLYHLMNEQQQCVRTTARTAPDGTAPPAQYDLTDLSRPAHAVFNPVLPLFEDHMAASAAAAGCVCLFGAVL